jgi:hypothetical protein
MVIFLEYLAWDIARANLPEYKAQRRKDPHEMHQRGMVITIVWLAFFIALFACKYSVTYFDGSIGFAAIAGAAFVGVFLYRRDKKYRWGWPVKLLAATVPFMVLLFLAYLDVH